jgi:c-di-GMP-binding flagellar brake protein YcgR
MKGLKKEWGREMEKGTSKRRTGIAKIEERKHPRFLLNLPIEYYRVDSDFNQAGYTVNASESGLMVNLPEKLEVGQLLQMKLFFSFGPDINSIEILSQVVWTDPSGSEEGYRSGVKFIEVSSESLKQLINFLQKLIK